MPFEILTSKNQFPGGGQVMSETSPSITPDATQIQRVKTILLGNKHGHDIRVHVPIRKDGSTVFDEGVRLKRCEVDELMYQAVSPGDSKSLPEYPYPVTILPGETTFFAISEDAVGYSSRIARLYVLGDHYKNGIGQRVPAEKTWSIRRDGYGNAIYGENGEIQKEEETVVFMKLSYSPYEPGTLSKRIIRTNSPNNEFVKTEELYESDQHKIVFLPIPGAFLEKSFRSHESTMLVAD